MRAFLYNVHRAQQPPPATSNGLRSTKEDEFNSFIQDFRVASNRLASHWGKGGEGPRGVP